MIQFYLNGKAHQVKGINPNTTVLQYLRQHLQQTDVKEGCASGDCGACTVMIRRTSPFNTHSDTQYNVQSDAQINSLSVKLTPEDNRFHTLNSCIALVSLLHNQEIYTASYLANNPNNHPDQALLHPAQQALVDHHGSQCGYCTPGFVMSLACLYENRQLQHLEALENNSLDENSLKDSNFRTSNRAHKNIITTTSIEDKTIIEAISGNLCRCTGYRPIIDAGRAMFNAKLDKKDLADHARYHDLEPTDDLIPALNHGDHSLFIPHSKNSLEQLLSRYPDAILWAGGTDLGLSITQRFIDFDTIIQLSHVKELQQWQYVKSNHTLVVGAAMTYRQLLPVLAQYLPEFANILHRIASPQIRHMGTIGGNIANASPIGDLPPILLALDAKIHIRNCTTTLTDDIIPLADFFISYKQTKLASGSYIAAIYIPLLSENQHLSLHKISKRYEDDISACLLALRVDLNEAAGTIIDARIGLGGMAGVPLLAQASQSQLINQPLSLETFQQAAATLPQDVTPLSDVRASREYRLHVVQRLLIQSGKRLINNFFYA